MLSIVTEFCIRAWPYLIAQRFRDQYKIKAVELLMSYGADPTIPNDEGESPIDNTSKIPVNWEKVKHLFSKYEND